MFGIEKKNKNKNKKKQKKPWPFYCTFTLTHVFWVKCFAFNIISWCGMYLDNRLPPNIYLPNVPGFKVDVWPSCLWGNVGVRRVGIYTKPPLLPMYMIRWSPLTIYTKYQSSLGRKDLIRACGPWTCMQSKTDKSSLDFFQNMFQGLKYI